MMTNTESSAKKDDVSDAGNKDISVVIVLTNLLKLKETLKTVNPRTKLSRQRLQNPPIPFWPGKRLLCKTSFDSSLMQKMT